MTPDEKVRLKNRTCRCALKVWFEFTLVGFILKPFKVPSGEIVALAVLVTSLLLPHTELLKSSEYVIELVLCGSNK